MHKYRFGLKWSFDNDPAEHKITISESADSVNEAFAKACVTACRFCEQKGNAHVVEITYQIMEA